MALCLAPRVSWLDCHGQEEPWVEQGTSLQQHTCWKEKDVEAPEHVVVVEVQVEGWWRSCVKEVLSVMGRPFALLGDRRDGSIQSVARKLRYMHAVMV